MSEKCKEQQAEKKHCCRLKKGHEGNHKWWASRNIFYKEEWGQTAPVPASIPQPVAEQPVQNNP
jgi:hypothetical protein